MNGVMPYMGVGMIHALCDSDCSLAVHLLWFFQRPWLCCERLRGLGVIGEESCGLMLGTFFQTNFGSGSVPRSTLASPNSCERCAPVGCTAETCAVSIRRGWGMVTIERWEAP